MIKIVLLGAGNVATHLFDALETSGKFKVVQVFNHTIGNLEYFRERTAITNNISAIVEADVYILALKDDVIEEVSQKLKNKNSLIVHTSGATSIDVLNNFQRTGVFYPLQTFTKGKEVNFKHIPLCIEANSEADLALLEEMAFSISNKVYQLSSPQRKTLHVAAVFVSNFVNFMYSEGEAICKEHDIPFDILHPLILETASKITNISPKQAQTGPALRKDIKIINSHLEQLNLEQQEIYNLLTTSIQNLHGKEL